MTSWCGFVRNGCRVALFALYGLVVLAACTTVEFDGAENRLGILPSELMGADVTVPQGTVVWGGRILGIVNLEDATEILMLALPLTAGNVPKVDEDSVGRFVIRVEGYLEPMDFAPGRYLSMAGQLDGMIGEWSYEGVTVDLPLVRSSQVHLWPREMSKWRTRVSFGLSVYIQG